jgi:signal transduction histidine kinase
MPAFDPNSAAPATSPAVRGFWSSPFGRWLLLTFVWLALAAVTIAQLASWPDMDWRNALVFALIDWGPWIVLSPLVLWFARRVEIDGTNWRRTVPLHVVGAVVFIGLTQLVTDPMMLRPLMPPPEGERRPPPPELRAGGPLRLPPPPEHRGGPPEPPPAAALLRYVRARFTLPIYCVLIAGAHAIAYHRRSLERERRALAAEARLTEARLLALQNQLNPHFLFNTLNAVSSLVYSQPAQADEMICALSELLRRVLATSDRREVTLAEELDFVDRYLAIQRIRFADRLDMRREIAPGLESAAVPTFILQPLVENAIIHGITPRATRGTVTLQIVGVAGRLQLTVSDTGSGQPLPPRRADGTVIVPERIGLGNTRARLASLYGDDAHFTLTPAATGGLCARLDLPLRLVTPA